MFQDAIAPLISALVEHQGSLVVIVSSWLVAWIATRFPTFADLGNWSKRAVVYVVAVLIAAIVTAVGGISTIDFGAILVDGGVAGTVASSVFRIGRTTPTTRDAALTKRES